MRKILCMLLTGIMVLSAAGCGTKEIAKEPVEQDTIVETTENKKELLKHNLQNKQIST